MKRSKQGRRFTAFFTAVLFCFALLSGIGPAAKKVYAKNDGIEWVDVTANTYEELTSYLKNEENSYRITLKSDIDHGQCFYDCTYVIEIKGTKMLNLNGHSVEVRDKTDFAGYDDDALSKLSLFYIRSGSTFFLDDVTEEGIRDNGMIHFDGYIHSAYNLTENMILARHIFWLDGGTFNMLGGRVIAGRSKQQWVTHAYVRQEHDFSCDQLKSYTGNARNQINGSALLMYDGNFNMTGGYLEGRGFSYLSKDGPWEGSTNFGAITVDNGNINIYLGRLVGLGGADGIKVSNIDGIGESNPNIKVWSVRVEERDLDYLIIPWQDNLDQRKAEVLDDMLEIAVRHYAVYHPMKPGQPGIDSSMIAVPERTVIYESKNGYETPKNMDDFEKFTPEEYHPKFNFGRSLIIMPEAKDAETAVYRLYENNHPSQSTFIYDPNFDDAPVFMLKYDYKYKYDSTLFWPATDFDNEIDRNYKVAWEIYDAYGKMVEIMDGTTTLTTGNSFNTSKYPVLLANLEEGKSYVVKAVVCENFGSEKFGISIYDSVVSMGFTVKNTKAPEIVTQPSNRSSFTYGRNEFLMAKAKGATSVKWFCIDDPANPVEVPASDYSFNSETGNSSLDVYNVKSEHKYFARFINTSGYVDTDPAYVCYDINFGSSVTSEDPFLKRPDYVTGIEGGSVCINNPCTADYPDSCPHLEYDRWFYYSDSIDNATRIPIGSIDNPVSKFYVEGNRLYIRNLTLDDCGYYYREVKAAHSYEHASSPIYLNVNESGAADIDGVVVKGFDKLYKGQDAEEASGKLKFFDNRFIVNDIKWQQSNTYSDSESSLTALSENPTVFIKLEARTGYRFYNSEGDLRLETNSGAYSSYICNVDGTALGSEPADEIMIVVSYNGSGDYSNYLLPVQDKVIPEKYDYTYYITQEVDENLNYSVECPEEHKELHNRATFSIEEGELPKGLTLDEDGRIHGTVTEEAPYNDVLMPVIKATANGSGDVTTFKLSFNVIEKTVDDADLEAAEVHSHNFCDWYDISEYSHERICDGCDGDLEGGTEIAPHRYGEAELIGRSVDGQSLMIKKICIDCGFEKIENIAIEEDDELFITVNPVVIRLYKNETAVIQAFANVDDTLAATLSYYWEYSLDDGKTWKECTEEGAKTSKITVKAGNNSSVIYRCTASNETLGTATSELVDFAVIDKPVIKTEPSAVNVIRGSKGKFTVEAEGLNLSYQWMYSKDNGKTWKNSGSTGSKTATLTIIGTENLSGRLYKCRVKNKSGYTDTKAVKFTTRAVVSENPDDQNVTIGSTATFSIKSRSSVATYQWEVSKDEGQTWSKSGSTGNKTTTLTIDGVKASYDGWLYRCHVTNGTWEEYSDNVILTIDSNITSQPKNQTVYYGDDAKFTVKVTGVNLEYQWQVSANGTSWSNSSATGANTPTLTVVGKASLNKRMFRCKITNGSTVKYTNYAILTTKANIISEPGNTTVKAGKKATFSLEAGGTKLSYQWEFSTDGGKTWKNSGVNGNKTDTISFVTQAKYNGYFYRCKIINGSESCYSKAVKLNVK